MTVAATVAKNLDLLEVAFLIRALECCKELCSLKTIIMNKPTK